MTAHKKIRRKKKGKKKKKQTPDPHGAPCSKRSKASCVCVWCAGDPAVHCVPCRVPRKLSGIDQPLFVSRNDCNMLSQTVSTSYASVAFGAYTCQSIHKRRTSHMPASKAVHISKPRSKTEFHKTILSVDCFMPSNTFDQFPPC